ncbi:lectin-like domain-containing protein [Haloglycomyces albus]|uniref:lectin-like domain-containing protein n=1 Tax=Haloglycomyces albus TaxID=526067 RepID=UPI0004ACA7C6|nr:hypothetical protein [Haloglycomyces albus]
MKRLMLLGASSIMIASGILTAPAAQAQSGGGIPESLADGKEDFHNAAVYDDNLVVHGDACLTAATETDPDSAIPACGDDLIGPVPRIGKEPGYLMLTDQGNNRRGSIIHNDPIPAEQGIEVTFAQWQYSDEGADGISFFLTDGDTDVEDVGGYGGSLGYAPLVGNPGIEGGFLGLGLDAWGNFSADSEGRGEGCPAEYQAPDHLSDTSGRAPENIALRGPGDGLEGYCLLDTTATDEVVGEEGDTTLYGSTLPHMVGDFTRDIAKRLVRLTVSGHDNPEVTVDMDFLDGNGWVRALEATVPFEAPDSYKYGFAASTGAMTDVHLIRHLRIDAYN